MIKREPFFLIFGLVLLGGAFLGLLTLFMTDKKKKMRTHINKAESVQYIKEQTGLNGTPIKKANKLHKREI